MQVACPLTGKPVNKEAMVEVGEAKVGFCCKNCLAKYKEADDDAKLEMVFSASGHEEGLHPPDQVPGERQADRPGSTPSNTRARRFTSAARTARPRSRRIPKSSWRSCRSLRKASEEDRRNKLSLAATFDWNTHEKGPASAGPFLLRYAIHSHTLQLRQRIVGQHAPLSAKMAQPRDGEAASAAA